MERDGVSVSRIKITNSEGEKALGRPAGNYITVEFPDILSVSAAEKIKSAVAYELKALLPKRRGLILAVGLGNPDVTPDCIGPFCARRIFATRHIPPKLAATAGLEGLSEVAVLTPGVTGQTGMEAAELIRAAVKALSPIALLVIDALAARSTARLFKTVQLCDTGIAPGSGVNNARSELSLATMGVPVIALGIPTVIDSDTLTEELTGMAPAFENRLFVTPKEVDLLTRRASELLAETVNSVLQPSIAPETIAELV